MKPKYLDEVIKRGQAILNEEPGIYDVQILHDDWCDLLNAKGPCNCEPEVKAPRRRLGASLPPR